jgi:hypothetical protein
MTVCDRGTSFEYCSPEWLVVEHFHKSRWYSAEMVSDCTFFFWAELPCDDVTHRVPASHLGTLLR